MQLSHRHRYRHLLSRSISFAVDDPVNPNDPAENLTIKVTTTDGTQMSYSWLLGAYRCTQIKDRNGNYITIGYDTAGQLTTITDTLARVVTIHRDTATGFPTSITQTWNDDNGGGTLTPTHTYATFTYATKTVATDFGTTLAVAGPPNGMDVTVLDKVKYADDSYTKFSYNGYLQVVKIENFAKDDHVLNRVSTNLDSVSGTQADCPRFTQTRSYAENFNGGQNVVVHNEAPVSDGYSVGGLTGSAAKVVVHMDNHPHELYSQLYFGESGWKEGLPLATEDCTGTWTADCSTRKRWTWTDWDQDNTNLAYTLNPRVEETRVGDGTNTKRTTIEYWLQENSNASVFGLVKSAFVYDTDLSTVLKQTYTEYQMDSAYTSRRIIGLPSLVTMAGRETIGLNLMSKVTYAYDQGTFGDTGLQQDIAPVKHDGTSYGSSFVTGRGNLTSTKRWDVTDRTIRALRSRTRPSTTSRARRSHRSRHGTARVPGLRGSAIRTFSTGAWDFRPTHIRRSSPILPGLHLARQVTHRRSNTATTSVRTSKQKALHRLETCTARQQNGSTTQKAASRGTRFI